ncbi:Imm57 family immunity protein [Pseudoxanthomonas winnipegensis]|uniref:Imm57 family immunity protein n=1 Tax=Pseudoxanthomonas winnipegensis TaxID=2480810 RepID=UPI003CE49667
MDRVLKIFGGVTTCLLLFIVSARLEASGAESRSDLARLSIEAANNSAVAAMLISTSMETRYLCATQKYSCLTQNGVESALSLFFAGSEDYYQDALLDMIRFKLDAGGAELFHSYISLLPKKGFVRASAALKIDMLADRCTREVTFEKKRIGQPLSARPEDICRSVEGIKAELLLLKSMRR